VDLLLPIPMRQVLADVEHHLQFRLKNTTNKLAQKKPLEFRGAF
jgi:hypothetical protein